MVITKKEKKNLCIISKKEVTQCLYFIKMSFIISWIEKMNIYIEERKFEEDRKNTDERSNRRYFAE